MNALKRPVTPDEWLGSIVGYRKQPRTQITKKLWAYIKKHRLQGKTDRREILADDRLIGLFNGNRRVHMLDLPGYVSDHIED